MSQHERFVARCRAAVQEALPGEPVISSGLLARVGATKFWNLIFINLPAAILLWRRGRRRALGFPLNLGVALTSTHLVFFRLRRPPRVGRFVARLDLASWNVAVTPASHRRHDLPILALTGEHGQRLEFEILQKGRFRAVNDQFVSDIPAPIC